MKSFRNILSSVYTLGFLLLPSVSVVTCFVIPPISGAPTPSSSTPTSVCQSSQQEQEQTTMKWFQHELSITAPSRGCHLITSNVQKVISKDLKEIKMGMCNLFVQHTSASLTINENADPDVRRDLEVALNKIVPASWNHDGTFRHTMEGDDDMPGHVKTSLMGPSLNIPIRNGRLALGTWQGTKKRKAVQTVCIKFYIILIDFLPLQYRNLSQRTQRPRRLGRWPYSQNCCHSSRTGISFLITLVYNARYSITLLLRSIKIVTIESLLVDLTKVVAAPECLSLVIFYVAIPWDMYWK